MVVCLRCLLHHILSLIFCIYVPGKPGICFRYYGAVYDECKHSDKFWLADRTRLFVQYTISLSSLCKLIWRHWTYKMPVKYILSSVWVRLSIFSPLSILQYVGLYVFSLPISIPMTSSNGNIVRVTGHLCGEFTGHRWIPRTKASDAELWCFLWSALNVRLSKQSWGWWFSETPSRPSWRQSSDNRKMHIFMLLHVFIAI